MKRTWVIVANGSVARIYQAEGKTDFSLAHSFYHDKSRKMGTELKSDRAGRVNDKFGSGKHAMEETTPPKKVEMQRFAHEIANYLDDSRKRNLVERIYLSSSPHFLGLLQSALSSHVADMVVETISKDFTALTDVQLAEKISISTLG